MSFQEQECKAAFVIDKHIVIMVLKRMTAVPNHQAAIGGLKVLHGVWPPSEAFCRSCFAPVRVRQIVHYAHFFLEQTAPSCRDRRLTASRFLEAGT
jgi:hypothetical protein